MIATAEVITEATDAFLRMVGYDRADVLSGGFSWRAITPPEYRSRDDAGLVCFTEA